MKSLLVAAALGLAASSASAANLYWDAAGTTIDGASQGGTGTWTTGNWDNGLAEQLWADGNAAFIGATSNITLLGGTSAAPSNISASSLTITGGTTTLFSDIAPTTAGQPVAKLTLTGGGAINNAAVLVLGGSGSGSLGATRPVALILGGDITNTGGIGQVQVRGNSVISSDGATARIINAHLFLSSGDGTNTATFGYGTSTGNLTFTGNLTSGAPRVVNVLTGMTVTVNGTATAFILGSQSTGYNGTFKVLGGVAANVANTGGGTLELAGAVSGASTVVTNSGTGTTVLSGANSYGGATIIQNGTLQLTGSLDSATTLNLGNGTNSGKLILGNSGAAKSQTVAGLTTTGTGSANAIVGGGNATASTLTVNLASGSNTFGGTIGGTGTNENAIALVKQGAGTLVLSGTNTYTGGTTVSQGILELTGGNTGTGAGGIRGTANVTGGAQLRLSANDATGYATDGTRLSVINLNGATDISGTGTLHVNTTLNMTLGSAVINMTGASITGIASSNLDFFGGSSALNSLASSTTSVISGVTLSALRQGNTTFTVAKGTTASGLDLDILSVIRTSPSNDPANAVLTKAGLGTLRLKGANTAGSSGAGGQTLSIAAGTLVTGDTAALGTYTVRLAGGTLQVGDASYIAAGASGTAVQTVNLGSGKNLVTAAGASILKFDSATSAIVLSGGGKYDFSAGTVTLDLSNAFNTVGSYNLITGGTSNVDAASYAFANANTGAFNFSFANGTLLVAIPEPSTYGLLGAGALAAVVAVRRRKRAAK